ncbi:C4-dicarboxylate transporter, DctM subunit [Caldanaerovirga acetigignens]|uniref:C4-dicarboxylate transporter, DctM subunit n=1 Tax=Caldanaerovirga acetigignens TaxID=447595 RepID=A0A1M7LRS9_9FIRM|nr:TRAP transporter large permease [Caldanaerovirga acetigignens]SHM80412.1 C4-dicarboxylate transporter, DctM subunit [Caldanaerovirga acetigignens]
MITVFLVSAVLFLFLGFPIAVTVGLSSVIYILASGIKPLIIIQRLFAGIDMTAILAIPFFVLAGDLMNMGGLAKRLVRLANSVIGNATGGLAVVTILGCMFFAAISGSGVATAAALGSIMIPAMVKRGYDIDFASAVVASAAPIGVIIPPSISFVIIGVLSGTSIADLYKAGIPAGIITGIFLIIVSVWMSSKRNYKGEEIPFDLKNIWNAFKDAVWALGTPLILIGGVFGGVFTPTESAAVAVAYAIIVGRYIYKEMSWNDILKVFITSAKTSARILFIISNASLFAWVLTIERIPQQIMESFLSLSNSPIVLLLIINVILLIAGCFLESGAIQVITVPLLWPVITKFGINPVHFGIVMTVNLAIGLMTPPFGVVLYTTSSVAGTSIHRISAKILPFFVAMVVALLIITYIPQSVMFML